MATSSLLGCPPVNVVWARTGNFETRCSRGRRAAVSFSIARQRWSRSLRLGSMKFKDYFDRAAARALAAQVSSVYADFDERAFVQRASKGLGELEFSGRVSQFARALRSGLPMDISRALETLTRSLPPALPDCEAVTDGWLQWPLGQFIADYGFDDFDGAMAAMVALTQRFSSEFAVRPFVEARPEETFERLYALTSHDSPHVRRWCSEGVRPRLPWGKRLGALVHDPSPIWPILDALKDDDEPYVRRSVANNLNDIAKDHPDRVVEQARQWMQGAKAGRAWVVRHGLRTLVKNGHPGALALLGFENNQRFEAALTVRPKRPEMGSFVELHLMLTTPERKEVNAVVDYRVEFARPGGRSSSRVFKWTKLRLSRETGPVEVTKRHPLRHTTTRELFPGRHRVKVQVNGAVLAEAHFDLRAGGPRKAK